MNTKPIIKDMCILELRNGKHYITCATSKTITNLQDKSDVLGIREFARDLNHKKDSNLDIVKFSRQISPFDLFIEPMILEKSWVWLRK